MPVTQHRHTSRQSSIQSTPVVLPQGEEHEPKNLQVGIIKRFLSDTDYRSFISSYRTHRKNGSGYSKDRAISLSIPLTNKEQTLLDAYINDTDTSVADIGRNLGYDPKKVGNIVIRAALRYLYQNRDQLV